MPTLGYRTLAAEELVQPVFSQFSLSEIGERARWGPHQHFSYEVIVVERGTYVCKLNQETVTLKRHQALVVKPGDWHEDECIPPLRYRGMIFHIERPLHIGARDGGLNLFDPSATPADQVFHADPKIFRPLLRRLESEASHDDFASQLVLDALLREFFWRVVRALKPERLSPLFQKSTVEKSFVLRLQRLFEAQQSRHLPVSEMARAMAMSERTLDLHCRRILKESPARCFARFKIDRAAAFLRQTDMPIKEISHFLGFENPYHFSRVFRRFTGKPPSSVKAEATTRR